MKYMVMETHDGYAVLMDEDARFVHAANLHYNVGDTVTEPIIMNNDPETASKGIKMIVTRAAAAAACIGLLIGGGYTYYANNFKPHSTIIISSEANITMELNKKGKVLSLKSNNDTGREILKDYDGKGKDKSTVAKEILEIEKSKGIISEGDTVEVYVLSDDDSTVSNCITDIEQEVSAPEIKVNVKDVRDYESPQIKTPTAPAAPVEPKNEIKPPEPVTPPTPEENVPVPDVKLPEQKITTPTAPAAKEPTEVPVPEHKIEHPRDNRRNESEKAEPVAPPTPNAEVSEPEKPAEVVPPTPEKPADEPTPPAPAEEKKNEPLHPEHEQPRLQQREERNVVHKPNEGLNEPAHPIPDTNLIDNVLPDVKEP
ncbi:MAG: hypothetical protein IJ779_01425 [Ruminococcus sp.]|nr:hypothetical protein [Ruminococcus sp.]